MLSGRPDDVARSITFTALLVGNLSLILVNWPWRLSVWQPFRQRSNATLKWIPGAATILPILFRTVLALQDAFSFGPMTAWEWLAAGFAGMSWFEVYESRARR